MFVGFNLTFGPMHFLGVDGMPRRIYTYGANQGWSGWFGMDWLGWNMVVTIGAFIIWPAMLVFMYNVFQALRGRRTRANDPWDARDAGVEHPLAAAVYNFAVAAGRPLA